MNNTEIVDHVLIAEGWPKYTNRASDRGGPTKGGITLKTLRSVHPGATIDDLKALTEAEARLIYERDYIVAPGFSTIADDLLRWQVVDGGIMSGQPRATKWLQLAAGVTADGVFGPKTAAAVNALPPHVVALRFCAIRVRFLGELITNDKKKTQHANAAGWMNRCTGFLDMEAKSYEGR